jgi:hypothetical protein
MRTAVRPGASQSVDRAARRLLSIAGAYLPVVATGGVLFFVYRVGARPGGDPRADIVFRGTALAPPLFLPASMVGGAALARAPGRAGAIGTAIAGAVGIACLRSFCDHQKSPHPAISRCGRVPAEVRGGRM